MASNNALNLNTPASGGVVYFDGTNFNTTSVVTMNTGGFNIGNAVYGFQGNLNADRFRLLNHTNGSKIASSGVGSTYSHDNYAGLFTTAGGGISTGQFTWLVVDGTGAAWVNRMTLSNTGVLTLPQLTASSLIATDGSSNLITASGTYGISISGNAATATSATSATTATTATNATNVATTSTTTNASFYPLFVSSTTNGNQASDLYGGLSFNPSTAAMTLINSSSPPTAPTGATQLNIASSTQASARIVLSGQEFFASGHTDTNGIAFLAGVNRTNNRQLWIGDSARMASTSANPLIQIALSANGNTSTIASIATDGTTALPIQFGTAGSITTVTGNSIVLGAIPTFNGTNTTGAGVTAVGTNCPAVTPTHPYTWIQAVSSDGSTVYIPAWK